MASRASRVNSWQETLSNVAKAKKFTERFGIHEAHPSAYLDPLPADEERVWKDLLSKI